MMFLNNHWAFHGFVPLLPASSSEPGYWASCSDDRTHNHQSTVEPEHSRQAHNSPSLTSRALPGVNSPGKEISPCATTPSSCQEQSNITSPATITAWPPEERSAEGHYLTQTLYLRVYIKFCLQFPTFLQLTLYQREAWCFKMPLQSYSSQGVPKFELNIKKFVQ